MKKILAYTLFTASSMVLVSCNSNQENGSNAQGESETTVLNQGQGFIEDGQSEKNILQIAISSPDHTTLVAAVKAASLEHVLANNGPLTVFAPNNEAFSKLPEGTVENLLKPENKKTLANIITYHASPGTYTLDELKKETELYEATGDYVKITQENGQVLVNGARILASVDVSNGIVHVIDQVLLPPEK